MTTTYAETVPAAPAFRASEQFSAHLQRVLVDLIELHLQRKQAHWNVVGANFRDLHLQLDEIVDTAREFSDQVAERMRALWATPDGRSATVAAQTSPAPFPDSELATATVVALISDRLYTASRTLRDVHDDVDHEGPDNRRHRAPDDRTAGMHAWPLSAGTRTPGNASPFK